MCVCLDYQEEIEIQLLRVSTDSNSSDSNNFPIMSTNKGSSSFSSSNSSATLTQKATPPNYLSVSTPTTTLHHRLKEKLQDRHQKVDTMKREYFSLKQKYIQFFCDGNPASADSLFLTTSSNTTTTASPPSTILGKRPNSDLNTQQQQQHHNTTAVAVQNMEQMIMQNSKVYVQKRLLDMATMIEEYLKRIKIEEQEVLRLEKQTTERTKSMDWNDWCYEALIYEQIHSAPSLVDALQDRNSAERGKSEQTHIEDLTGNEEDEKRKHDGEHLNKDEQIYLDYGRQIAIDWEYVMSELNPIIRVLAQEHKHIPINPFLSTILLAKEEGLSIPPSSSMVKATGQDSTTTHWSLTFDTHQAS